MDEELTVDELAMAKSFGMTPEAYAAYRDPSYHAPPAAVLGEHERLKAAVRAALDERDQGAT